MKRISEQTSLVLVFGRKGTGKTTWLKKCAKKIQGKKTILLVDTINNFSELDSIEIKSASEFLDYIVNKGHKNKTFLLNTIDINEIIKTIYLAYMQGNISIFFDEGDIIFNRNMNHYIREIVLRGRNQGIDLLIATLRPHKIAPDVRTQADVVVIFSLKNKHDIKAIGDEFGVEGIEKQIMDLNGHEYIKYSVNDGSYNLYSKTTRNYVKSGTYKGLAKKRKAVKAAKLED